MSKKPTIYVWSADHSGYPLAKRFQDEGHAGGLVLIRPERRKGKLIPATTPKEKKDYQERTEYLSKNGNGVVKKMWAEDAMRVISKKDYCLFDQIYGWQYGEALFKRGVPTGGGSKMGFALETERLKTLRMLKGLGYDIPNYKNYGPGATQQAIAYLKGLKDKTLYAFKSDNPQVETYVAHESNDEIIQKLEAEKKMIDTDGFLLQEKKIGIEFAVETWYSNGKPILADIDIEAKKKYNEMSEPQTGCAMGITWTIPVNHPLRERVNGPLDKFAKQYIGTGLIDVGVIYDPHEDKMWVLECCGSRWAYNAFYALMAKCRLPLGDFFIKYLNGEFKGDIGEKVFGNEVAASLRVFNDGYTPDQHIAYPKELEKHYWLWDCYRKGGDLLTTGSEYGDSLGIITAIGENPEGALAKVRQLYFKLYMPKRYAREDFDEDDDINLPLSRYHAMRTTKLIE